MLTDTFIKLVSRYSADVELANELWLELFSQYSDTTRHYHTISHLENMFAQLLKVREDINEWDTVLFALFYHDVVYKATGNSNESDSAKFAFERLSRLSFPESKIKRCMKMIEATKEHVLSEDADTNYLTDTDLSILGADIDDYRKYTRDVREEYSIYPDFLYVPGRKKVLRHFLEMDRIFKTDYFYSAYEATARQNLRAELDELSS